VAECLERGRDIVPCGAVEPQASDEQDIHDQFSFSREGQITFGIESVFSFLVKDDAETLLDREAFGPGQPGWVRVTSAGRSSLSESMMSQRKAPSTAQERVAA
jgi:hypothetical protein